jgi:hypothetical protein
MCASLLNTHECPMCRGKSTKLHVQGIKEYYRCSCSAKIENYTCNFPRDNHTYVHNEYQPSFLTFRNCPDVTVPILASTDDSRICYAKCKPVSIVNSSRWESIRACMCGSKRRALVHVSTWITICETLVTYTQSDCRTLCNSFCVVGDLGWFHPNKYPNSVLYVITPFLVCC